MRGLPERTQSAPYKIRHSIWILRVDSLLNFMNSIKAHEKYGGLRSSKFSLHSSFTVASCGEGTLSTVQQKWHFHFRRRNGDVFTFPGTNALHSRCAVQSEIGS